MSHGAGGKWYLNARNYSKALADEYQIKEHLTEVYKDWERLFVKRSVYGMSGIGLGYKLRMPIIGRAVRHIIESVAHNLGPKRRNVGSDGHFGQVIPVEDAKLIFDTLEQGDKVKIVEIPVKYLQR